MTNRKKERIYNTLIKDYKDIIIDDIAIISESTIDNLRRSDALQSYMNSSNSDPCPIYSVNIKNGDTTIYGIYIDFIPGYQFRCYDFETEAERDKTFNEKIIYLEDIESQIKFAMIELSERGIDTNNIDIKVVPIKDDSDYCFSVIFKGQLLALNLTKINIDLLASTIDNYYELCDLVSNYTKKTLQEIAIISENELRFIISVESGYEAEPINIKLDNNYDFSVIKDLLKEKLIINRE